MRVSGHGILSLQQLLVTLCSLYTPRPEGVLLSIMTNISVVRETVAFSRNQDRAWEMCKKTHPTYTDTHVCLH